MTSPLPLAGQAAIITGGGAGIGRAIALALAGAGADIVIADIVRERCEEVAARVRELGRTALPLPTDVSDTAQVATMVARTLDMFKRVDILVNNAGGTSRKAFCETKEHNWRRIIDLNLMSLISATSAVIPHMIAGERGGVILNVTSIEGSRAAPNFAVYAACKAAMNNFTRTMAVELGEHGIRVNAIAPDFTETPGLRGNISGPVDPATFLQPSPEQTDALHRRIPLGRGGVAEECGEAALFLVSPASRYVTGVILPVDGGTWASGGWVRNREGQWVLSHPFDAPQG